MESTPPPTVFWTLLKKSLADPYLKFLNFSQLLIADTPMNLFTTDLFYPVEALLGHPVQKYIFYFLL